MLLIESSQHPKTDLLLMGNNQMLAAGDLTNR